MAYEDKYSQIFDYLQAPSMPNSKTGALVFGRNDSLLTEPVRHLRLLRLLSWTVVSGGFGKDSGKLWDLKVPESRFIGNKLVEEGLGTLGIDLFLDEKSMTGQENARFGTKLMILYNLDHSAVTAVAHATSLRRLAATLEQESTNSIRTVFRMPTPYNFDPLNQHDQLESLQELLRLAHWPANGWLPVQDDIPSDLLDFATDMSIQTPNRPSPMVPRILRCLPLTMRRQIIEKASR